MCSFDDSKIHVVIKVGTTIIAQLARIWSIPALFLFSSSFSISDIFTGLKLWRIQQFEMLSASSFRLHNISFLKKCVFFFQKKTYCNRLWIKSYSLFLFEYSSFIIEIGGFIRKCQCLCLVMLIVVCIMRNCNVHVHNLKYPLGKMTNFARISF